jgi:transcription termination/antitermination protein NusG
VKYRRVETIRAGDLVRVSNGAFASFRGTVEEVDEKSERLKVVVSIYGRTVAADLDFGQVEKL